MNAGRWSGPEKSAEVDAYLAARPGAVAAELARLRAFVHGVAARTPGVGPLAESLKWGEPSLTPARSGVGSSVRLAALKDGRVGMHFICHTGLVDRFRDLYPATFDYGGNRSIQIEPGEPVDEAALAHCVAMALRFHVDGGGRRSAER